MEAFRKYIEKNHETAKVKLSVHKDDGSYVHFCDLAPFGSNQNFRAPWNQKPGKNPLLPRSFDWVDNRLVFTAATVDPRVINAETLFRAHPNLALPTKQGYNFLEMPEDPDQSKIVLKRKA